METLRSTHYCHTAIIRTLYMHAYMHIPLFQSHSTHNCGVVSVHVTFPCCTPEALHHRRPRLRFECLFGHLRLERCLCRRSAAVSRRPVSSRPARFRPVSSRHTWQAIHLPPHPARSTPPSQRPAIRSRRRTRAHRFVAIPAVIMCSASSRFVEVLTLVQRAVYLYYKTTGLFLSFKLELV